MHELLFWKKFLCQNQNQQRTDVMLNENVPFFRVSFKKLLFSPVIGSDSNSTLKILSVFIWLMSSLFIEPEGIEHPETGISYKII
jgi:hypothetical protein